MAKYALSVAAILAFALVVAAQDKKFKATDPVSGKAAKDTISSEYKGAKLYFETKENSEAFKKDTKKYAAKANLQLLETGQFEEKKCPIAGRDLNTDTTIEVSGVKVCFCCENCQGKVKKAKADEQVEMIFNDKAFEKAFAKKK